MIKIEGYDPNTIGESTIINRFEVRTMLRIVYLMVNGDDLRLEPNTARELAAALVVSADNSERRK